MMRRARPGGRLDRAVAIATVFLILGGATRVMAADACDLMVATLAAEEGVQFERRTEGGTIHLKHPLARSLSIDCGPFARGPNLFATWSGAYPPAEFYTFLGRAAAVVVKKGAGPVVAGAKRCQGEALKSKDGQAEIHTGGLEFDCQAFTRNGGSSSFTIGPDQPS